MTSGALRSPWQLAIDTNVLVLLIAYRRLEPGPRRDRILHEIRGRSDRLSPERFDALWELFRRAKRRVITQHVVAEVYGLKDHWHLPEGTIWIGAIYLLTQFNIEELPCWVGELRANRAYGGILERLGPADTGLLYTAERESLTLVTEDGPLLNEAYRRSIPVTTLTRL